MNFLENIFSQLSRSGEQMILAEGGADADQTVTGPDLLARVETARGFLRAAGLAKSDRCALLAPNGIRWVALDLAVLAEGLIAVPLYARQSPVELATMMRDAGVSLICCGDELLSNAIATVWPGSPRRVLFEEIFASSAAPASPPQDLATPLPLAYSDTVAIIYTSGTSGEAKGVMLTVGNLNHMLSCTAARLDQLMSSHVGPDHVFHYLPFCFAGSWILLLSCLSRTSELTLSTDLTKLADEIGHAGPNYFLNVPTLLERMRTGIQDNIQKRGGAIAWLFHSAQAAWFRRDVEKPRPLDSVWLGLASSLIFPPIRKRLGPNLRALICGSAPLARDTQLFFMMIGIPVLQVYGLTETTAICTMDEPSNVSAGRVGPAIPGVEMKLGENSELLVRGPNIFPGYWNRPEQTSQVLRDGWFHTGDQADVDSKGNWRISGRLKNLIILESGHNIAPEPIEEELVRAIRGAQQAVLVGNGRGFVAAIITGDVARAEMDAAVEKINAGMPHYKKIRMMHVEQQPLTIESGMLTANGKYKRDTITARFAAEIERMYVKVKGQNA